VRADTLLAPHSISATSHEVDGSSTRAALRRARSCAALALCCSYALSCGPGLEREHVVHRFVDPDLRVGAKSSPEALVTSLEAGPGPASTRAIPIATLSDDSRYVLAVPSGQELLPWRPVAPSASGTIRVRTRLPRPLSAAARLVVTPYLSIGRARVDLEARTAEIDAEARKRGILLEIEYPAAAGATDVRLRAEALQAIDPQTSYETPQVEIPADARLDFAIGVGESRVGTGRVAFRVSACDNSHCTQLFDETRTFAGNESPQWTDHAIDLGSLAGKKRSFRFETATDGDPQGIAFPLWANPSIRSAGAGPNAGASLILISLDTLRADHLGLYGYRRDTSPFLDGSFGANGTVFERFTAAATTTGPSHMSIMTSLPPSQHGARSGLQRLSAPVPMLAEWLRKEGFVTAAFTENASLDRRRGFGRGFDVYVENKSSELFDPVGGTIEQTFERARGWLERNRGLRSFVFLHTYQVHAPYTPPPSYRLLFEGDAPDQHERNPEELAALNNYDREIRYTDDELAKLFGWLGEQALLERTLVVVTSDHGEEFLEHGSIGHSSLPHEELVHVPLMLQGGGVPRGRRVAALSSHIDLVPTLLELLGVEPPGHVRGRSLVPLMADRPLVEGERRAVFSETWTLEPPYEPPGVSVRLGDDKLISFRTANGPGLRLYDLEADPGEQSNVARNAPHRVSALRKLLDEYTSQPRRGGKEVELDSALEQKLRALGYLD
jgi:arylsulfatase A-like enzyme